MLDGGLSRWHPKPLGCKLEEGAVHVLCDQVPKGTFTLIDVEVCGTVWACTRCGQEWLAPADEAPQQTLTDMGLEHEDEFSWDAELSVPRYRTEQVAELCRMYLIPDSRS
jgi:hypothetical protein